MNTLSIVQNRKLVLGVLLGIMYQQSTLAEERCDNYAAVLESAEGTVRWRSADSEDWTEIATGFEFCFGETAQTLQHRAALRLSNDTLVRLNENSTIHFSPESESFFVRLIKGAGHFLSRTPNRFEVQAPYMNAAVDGTEFSVDVSAETNTVAVFEGSVNVQSGNQVSRLTNGQQTQIMENRQAGPIQRITLRDAAAWTLYYPPIFYTEQVADHIQAHINSANYGAALAQLQASTRAADLSLAASLSLTTGDHQGATELLRRARAIAPNAPDAHAVESFMTLVNGQPMRALNSTSELLETNPNNVNVLLAHSFALQANGHIEEALDVATRAHERAPNAVPVLARRAELLLSVGKGVEANQLVKSALRQSPRHPHLNTLTGYIELSHSAAAAAQRAFESAVTADPNNALAHFGLGLVHIRNGDAARARQKMELAALLDPANSIFRSYLGKTYLEMHSVEWAQTQFDLAKEFDPQDPTPWFYEANLLQQNNQWSRSLSAVNEAVEKNDNRALFRPQNMLQSDAVVRTNNKQHILHRLNLNSFGQSAAGVAASDAPREFAAHQANALAYANGANDKLVASEALMARILKPTTAAPLGVGLETPGLITPNWLMPTKMAVNEHSALYSSHGLQGHFALQVGENATQSANWQVQASSDNISIDAGQVATQSDGFVQNHDLDLRIGEVNFHYRPANNFKVILSATDSKEDAGDLGNAIDGPLFNTVNRRHIETESVSAGALYETDRNLQLIWHSLHLDKETIGLEFVNFGTPATAILSKQETLYQHQLLVAKRMKNIDISFGGVQQKVIGEARNNWSPDSFGLGTTISEEESEKSRLFAAVEMSLHEDLALYGEVGYAEYRFEVSSDVNFQREETDHVIASHWAYSPALQLAIANWTHTADFLVDSTTLSRTQIYGIPLINDQIGFDRSDSTAVSIFGEHRDWQYSLLLSETDLTLAEIATARRGSEGLSNKQTKGDLHLLRPFKRNWLYHLRLTSIDSQTPFVANSTQVNRPTDLQTTLATSGIAVDTSFNLHLGVEAQFIHQETRYPALDALGETAYDIETEDVLIWNAQALYKPWFIGPEISLQLLNINNQRLSINQDFISGGTDVASAQRKIIPYGRIALLGIRWSL